MIRASVLFFLLMSFHSDNIFAQQKEDFVMYAKDSSVEIQQSLTVKQIPDSIGLSIEKVSVLNVSLNSHLNKINSINAEPGMTDQQKKKKIEVTEGDLFNSISTILNKDEFLKFKSWYQQAFNNLTF